MTRLDCEELTCLCCGRATLHLERLTAQCQHAAAPVPNTLVIGFGLLDGESRRVWRTAPSRHDGVALRFVCESCRAVIELAFAVHASSTAIHWQELAREIVRPALDA